MFHSSIRRLRPTCTYSRGQVITLLPQEKALVCIKVQPHRQDFCPRQIYQWSTGGTLCYLVKNTTLFHLLFRNVSLHTLLSHTGIEHKFIFLPSNIIIKLHKKWLRGFRVWYPLRKMFVMSQYSNKALSLI